MMLPVFVLLVPNIAISGSHDAVVADAAPTKALISLDAEPLAGRRGAGFTRMSAKEMHVLLCPFAQIGFRLEPTRVFLMTAWR
jgi:hypothetical protein